MNTCRKEVGHVEKVVVYNYKIVVYIEKEV